MPFCARCGDRFSDGGEWIRVRHNHPHMQFESDFCSTACAAAYLEDELDDTDDAGGFDALAEE